MTLFRIQIGRYRFAPALWPSVVFALVFPGLLGLGNWQMGRAADKQALVEQRAESETVEPLALNRAPHVDRDARYRPAVVTGYYRDEQQWLLDNRLFRGQPGYHVYTPFEPDGAHAPTLLVNRGWVAVGESREILPQLPVPSQRVKLTGRLDRPASVGLVIGDVPLQSIESRVRVQALDIQALARARGMSLLRYALVIDEAQPGGLQHDWSPIPQMGPEKHLGYAVQWFGLATALLIIYVGVNTRRVSGQGGDSHAEV